MSWAIRLADAGKRYVKYEDVPLLITRLRFRTRSRRGQLWAVRHVNLEAAQGEAIGVIGRNGSGKSTMLRMLAGVTAPTEGSVSVRGRVAPLISVGVGFHHELTGRENVYVSGLILGLSRREVDGLFDSIVDFAELGDFIDTPVKFYSSGMFVRLGFSVAVASRPDVLLVDEVLAVGDMAFQVKCFYRMEQMKEQGTTVVVVSHNLNAIRNTCSRTLVLHDGDPRFLGPTDEAISVYHDLFAHPGAGREAGDGEEAVAEILSFVLAGESGEPTAHIQAGQDVTFLVDARFVRDAVDPLFAFRITNESGQLAYAENTYGKRLGRFAAGEHLRCEVRMTARLTTGSFTATATIGEVDRWHVNARPLSFFVTGRSLVTGVADLGASIEMTRDSFGAEESEPSAEKRLAGSTEG